MLNEQTKHRIVGGITLLLMMGISLPGLLRHNAKKFSSQYVKVSVSSQSEALNKPSIRRFVPRDIAHVTLTQPTKVGPHQARFAPKIPKPQPIAKINMSASVASEKMVVEKKSQIKTSQKVTLTKAPAASKSRVKPVVIRPSTPLQKIRRASIEDGRYSIQLGSFANLENAMGLIHQLQKNGYQAKYIPCTRNNITLYTVLVGKLENKDKAKLLNMKLSQAYHVQGLVVAYG